MSDLVRLVSDASEDFWCAGWLKDAEFDLWARVQQYRRTGKCSSWGLASWEATTETVRELSEESKRSGEWAMWDEEQGPVTVPVDEWITKHWQRAGNYFFELASEDPQCGALGPMVPYDGLAFSYFSRCRQPAEHVGECVYLDSDGVVVSEARDTPSV